jgi:two-component system, cell cycle response regulator DivK
MIKKKVMIVDDNIDFLNELEEMLTFSGYEMVTVNEAQKAVYLARVLKPDVIVLDLKMPGRNGFQISRDLKEHDTTAHIPVIAMSAFFNKATDNELIKESGVCVFLEKPFKPLDVILQIEALTQKNQAVVTPTC